MFYVWLDNIPAEWAFDDVPGIYANGETGWLPIALCKSEEDADTVADGLAVEYAELVERHNLCIYRNPLDEQAKSSGVFILSKVEEVYDFLNRYDALTSAWPLARIAATARRLQAATTAVTINDLPCRHSADFRSINWHGTVFSFTRNQAACVKELWSAWEAGTPELDGLTLTVGADVSQTQLKDVFKQKHGMHPAWGTLVMSGATKGSYRLADGPITPAANKGRKKVPRKTPRKTPR